MNHSARRLLLVLAALLPAAPLAGSVAPAAVALLAAVAPSEGPPPQEPTAETERRPNILFCIADDWGYPHAGVYGEQVVHTPSFNRLATEGVLFTHAFVSSPSCTPSRGAILSGQDFWRLREGGSLWSTIAADVPLYPELLAASGYHVGSNRKGWGPGRFQAGGREQQPAGKPFKDFAAFLEARPEGAPFCFWQGSSDPHRGYELGSGAARGMKLAEIGLPQAFPDAPEIRSDVADYLFEVERFDRLVGACLEELEQRGELDDTIVVVTGDHGMPFPRGKGNLYDLGTRVPLALRWGDRGPPFPVGAFVSLTDLAPSFLEAAGVAVPEAMTGRSLWPLIEDGEIDESQTRIVFGRERHTPAQAAPSWAGYPSRAIRTHEFLLIRNFAPERWPAGVPEGALRKIPYSDCDNGPTKSWILAHREEPEFQLYYERAFAPRPEFELYDLEQDPEQWQNVAGDPDYAAVLEELKRELATELLRREDPRLLGGAAALFESELYFGGLGR